MAGIERNMNEPKPGAGGPEGGETGPKPPLAGLTPEEQQIVRRDVLGLLIPDSQKREEVSNRYPPDQINASIDSWLTKQPPQRVTGIINASLEEYRRDPQEKTPDWWPFDEERWKSLDIKDRTVRAAVLAMRHFYDMPNADRKASAGNFSLAYSEFAEYALGKKLYDGKDTRIIAVELEVVRSDEKVIKKYESDPTKQQQIVDALNRLDFLEDERNGIDRARKEYKITDQNAGDERLRPPKISREEWNKYLERPAQIAKQLEEAEKELVRLVGQGFVDERKRLKTKVEARVSDLKAVIKKENEKKGAQISEEPWEQVLEEYLMQDTETPLEQDNPYADKSVDQILRFIANEGEKPANQQNATALEQANKALEWNFHQARKLGIFEDLEERLGRRYRELALSLFSRGGGADQGDMEMEGRRAPRNLTLAEVKEILAKESDEQNKDSLRYTSDLDAAWRQLVRDGGISREEANHFKGIRKAFVSGAYDQMYDSISNLYKRLRTEELRIKLGQPPAPGTRERQQYDRRLREIDISRRSGEWDVRKQERLVIRSLDAEEGAQEDKLFYVDRYYLTLTGTTEAQVEQGVNNYLTGLLEGAHVYDVQTIMQKMQYLSAAIMSKKDVLMANGMSASTAQEALTRINILAENRGEFYAMNFVAQHLMMDDAFIPLYEKWGGAIGIEKMKRILDMNNGLVAPAMLLFLDPKNRLLFQPAGFNGRGMKNVWAQRTLRSKIKEQLVEELVNFQARTAEPTELMEQATWQDFLRKKFTDRTVSFQGKDLRPREAVDAAKLAYEQIVRDTRENPGSTRAEIERNLVDLRKAREEYTKLSNRYDRLLDEARSAVETTWQVFNIFGESARLGAPSIIMANGDHIDIEDATYFYKFAILDAMKKNGDTPARMRWRGYQWTKTPWQYDGQGNPIVKRKVNGTDTIFTLVKGLEDTGITKEEYEAFIKAAKALRVKGYGAVFTSSSAEYGAGVEHSFEEIVSRNDVRPVRNNFISNYKSSREIFANLTAIREAKKGRQPFVMNILERLDQSGRGKFTTLDRAKIDGKSLVEIPDERLKEIFEDAITDSLIFHITARQLARWEATFTPERDSSDNMKCDERSNIEGTFSTDRIYYGSQDIPWGVKRLQYLPEYWMTNKRERVGREWKMLPFIPLLKSGLAQECDAENLPDLIMNVNKEHIDEPGLKQIAAGFKDAQGWRQRGETSIDEQRGETAWSFWDKPTVDSAQVLKVVLNLPQRGGHSLAMQDYIKNPELLESFRIPYNLRKELVDIAREILKREAPLNVFLEAQLGYNRSAGGSGIGLEMGERWHYRELQWWLSEEGGSRQEQGGLRVNDDAATYFKFITIKNSWSDGMSILDEAWRQARGTRDAGASDQFPQLIINP